MSDNPTHGQSRRVLLALCVGIFAIGQFHRAAGSVVTPVLIDRLSLSAVAASTLMAVMFIATVSGQLPLGAALDRVGARWMLFGTTLLVAAGTALFAMPTDYIILLAGRVLMGLGFAVSGAAIHVIIANAFPRRDFAYTQGLIVSIGGVGGLLGTYPLAALLERLPWGIVFFGLAAFTVLLALTILRFVPRQPRTEASEPGASSGGYLQLLRIAELRKLLVLSIVIWAPIVVITGLWGGAYLQQIHGLSAEAAGGVLFGFYAATIGGAYIFGAMDRGTTRRKRLILGAAILSALCYLALAVLPHPGLWLAVAVLFSMIFLQQFHVPLSAHLRAIVPAEALGRASALYSLVAVAAIPAMQMGFGAILDLASAFGLSPEQGFRAGFGAVGLLIALASAVYATTRQANDV